MHHARAELETVYQQLWVVPLDEEHDPNDKVWELLLEIETCLIEVGCDLIALRPAKVSSFT